MTAFLTLVPYRNLKITVQNLEPNTKAL